jgi:MFS transporter, FHS family, L-fucose permease
VLLIIAAVVYRISFPTSSSAQETKGKWSEVLKDQGLLLGMLGIFTYVGAEVAIGSFLVNYVMELSHLHETQAAKMVSIYWGGAMVGRFIGIFTLKTFPPAKVLSLHALLAIALIVFSINSTGMLAIYSIVLVGFCNSIMFPTIFTLAIKGLKAGQEKTGSGLLATAILGGAIVPLSTGLLADKVGLQTAFILPVLCYAYIAGLGFKHTRKSIN